MAKNDDVSDPLPSPKILEEPPRECTECHQAKHDVRRRINLLRFPELCAKCFGEQMK